MPLCCRQSFLFFACWLLCALVALTSAERKYTLIMEQINVVKGEGDIFDRGTVKVTKVNRTVAALNGSIILLKDIPENTTASVVCYEKYGTEYKRSAVQFKSVDLCDFIKTEERVYPDIVKVSNLPPTCPVTKGPKHILNYLMEENNLPEELPGNFWRIDLILTHEEEDIVHVQLYFRIDRTKGMRLG